MPTFLAQRYELLEEIGQGGMAIVYKARCTYLDRLVAIKILRDQYASDPDFLNRFQREARAAAKLCHPSIVSIYDVGESQGKHFIVMEYVQGENLKDYLRREGPLSATSVVKVGRQVAAALAHAHQRGIVHRDIKPHNLLITPDKQVKVTDFGIAQAAAVSSLTETGVVLGSVHYFSPEQARGFDVDARSDIYALGVVMFELVTGELPFKGDSPIAIALRHIDEQPPALGELCPNVDVGLCQVVMKTMAKNAVDRYQTAGELDVALFDTTAEYKMQDEETRVLTVTPGRSPIKQIKKRLPGRNLQIAAASVVTFTLLAALIGGIALWRSFFLVPVVEVPSVLGLQSEKAEEIIMEHGFVYELLREQHSDEPAGTVLEQDPEPAALRKSGVGEKIRVVLSQGGELIIVPDVRGQSKARAESLLAQNKLQRGTVREEYDPVTPAGLVLGQEPAAKSELPAGGQVSLVLSLGPPPQAITIEECAGEDLASAQNKLLALGLKLGTTIEEPSNIYGAGKVIRTEPGAGSFATEGDQINFIVSKGPMVDDQELSYTLNLDIPQGPMKQLVEVWVISKDNNKELVFTDRFGPGERLTLPLTVRPHSRIKVDLDKVQWKEFQVNAGGPY